jgi:hypothetical protein
MQKTVFTIFFLLIQIVLFSQELNGIWKGTLTQSPGGCFPQYHIELQVTGIKNNLVTGVCYHYSDINNYVKKNFEGVYNPETKMVSISEKQLLTFHIPSDCTPCIRYYSLLYKKDNHKEYLTGEWGALL